MAEDDFTTNPDGTIDWTLYGVPEKVQREVEALAKAAGMPLGKFVSNAIYAYSAYMTAASETKH